MDDPIKKIVELEMEHNWHGSTSDPGLIKERLAKFASMIIEECAAVCYNSTLEDPDTHAMNLLYEFNINGARYLK